MNSPRVIKAPLLFMKKQKRTAYPSAPYEARNMPSLLAHSKKIIGGIGLLYRKREQAEMNHYNLNKARRHIYMCFAALLLPCWIQGGNFKAAKP